jgi:hypothetical protein
MTKTLVEFKVVGVTYSDFHMIANEVQTAEQVIVEWEKDNKFDTMAHAVYIRGFKVGYVSKDMVQELDMDSKFYVRRLNRYDDEVVGIDLAQVKVA